MLQLLHPDPVSSNLVGFIARMNKEFIRFNQNPDVPKSEEYNNIGKVVLLNDVLTLIAEVFEKDPQSGEAVLQNLYPNNLSR